MFHVTRTYRVTYHHPRGCILGRDVCLSDSAFRDRKALGAQLRAAGVLSTGARVTAFRGEAGGRVSLERRTPHSSLESLPVILECIPYDRDVNCCGCGARVPASKLITGHRCPDELAITSSEPGQTIDAGDVVITTTLHRLG